MQTREEVFSRVKKLLQLSKSENESEAALAATRAQELMLYHKIEAAELEASEEVPKEDIEEEELTRTSRRRLIRWKAALASALANAFHCRNYYQQAKIILCGRPSDIQTVRYLYLYLERELTRLAEEAYSRVRHQGVHGKTWKNNFYFGAVGVIGARLKEKEVEIIQTLEPTSKALVRLNQDEQEIKDYYKERSKGFGKISTSSYTYHHSARTQGVSAGRSVNLSSGKGLDRAKGQLKG